MAQRSDSRGAAGPAAQLADRLMAGIDAVQTALPPGARDLQMLEGIDPSGRFLLPLEVVVQAGIEALRDTRCVYTYGSNIMIETTATAGELALQPLRSDVSVERAAVGLLANHISCRHEESGQTVWFAPPRAYLQVLLTAEPLMAQLPRIAIYSRRPLFGPDFALLNPGYHAGPRYLIHGTSIEPDLEPLSIATNPLERLPRHLRTLLSGFCFRDAADLANTLALILTGLLVNHFVECGKPVALIDGNQPGVGKTLLMRAIGVVLDDVDPLLIHYTPDDEELQKRICATLRPNRQSVVLIDNAKSATGTPISSSTIEANSMAPEISLRILGVSRNFTRPNDVLWALTMNQTRVSPDLVSRGLPIRLEYEGDPRTRAFGRDDPISYAREHRQEILGELAGFVVRWTQQGRLPGTQSHRLHQWASVIGGVLNVNGFTDFLANYDDAAQNFNAELSDLTALAEIVLADENGPHITLITEALR